jgi:prolyl-tRNA editing enzyme YbaK/EbsC (Cys-tRNA(Pro) deacylase)
MKVRSVDRVRRALLDDGHKDSIAEFPEGTRIAADASRAIGCSVSQIVKSMVFSTVDKPVLVLTSGTNRFDEKKVTQLLGISIRPSYGTPSSFDAVNLGGRSVPHKSACC